MSEKLTFITKTTNRNSKQDISLSLIGKKKLSTSITFRNNVQRSITKTGYLVVAISGERLYFRESEPECGYKVSNSDSKSSVHTSITNEGLNDFSLTHAGDYPLQFDRELKLFYIDTE